MNIDEQAKIDYTLMILSQALAEKDWEKVVTAESTLRSVFIDDEDGHWPGVDNLWQSPVDWS